MFEVPEVRTLKTARKRSLHECPLGCFRAPAESLDIQPQLPREERTFVLMQLERMARDTPEPRTPADQPSRRTVTPFANPRRLSPIDAVRTRKRVLGLVSAVVR